MHVETQRVFCGSILKESYYYKQYTELPQVYRFIVTSVQNKKYMGLQGVNISNQYTTYKQLTVVKN